MGLIGPWQEGCSVTFVRLPWLLKLTSAAKLVGQTRCGLDLAACVQASLGDDAKVSQDVMRQAGMSVSAEDELVSETKGKAQGKKEGDTEE